MSVASSSNSSSLPSGARKRKLNPNHHQNHSDPKQQKLSFLPQTRYPSDSVDLDPDNMASSSSASGRNNHKISLTNSHAAKVSTNHTKKPGQGKKLVIKNRKVCTNLPENYSEEAWCKLRESIRAVHSSTVIGYSLEELYRAVENSCCHGKASQLYDNLYAECKGHMESLLPQFHHDQVDEEQFLVLVDRQWKAFCQQMIMIRSIFLYLDRTYAIPDSSKVAIWEMGLELFRSIVIIQPRVQERITKGILSAIHRERIGESIDRSLLKNLLRMYVDLQIYQELFELDFLGQTECLYRAEALKMMRDMEFTLPDYLAHVNQRLSHENDRAINYLHSTTKKPLIMCVEKQVVGDHLQEILDKGFESLLEAGRHSDLSLLFHLFSRFREGMPLLQRSFSGYIKKSGAAIVSDPERDKTMIQELLELKSKVDRIIRESFQNQSKFYDVVRDSFESVINRRQNKPAELVAKYIDTQLKSGNKEWSDEELDNLLDNVMVLFRYIHGKDVFEAFYKKDLAKRLLLGKSASFDAEKSMLLKLKQECGPNFTSKLEGMFKDIELSKDIMTSFKQFAHSSEQISSVGMEMNVNVLTMGYWPTYTPMDVHLPLEMAKYLDVFKDFYLRKHNGRKLQWQASLGQCVLKATFSHSVKELQVSLFQTLILLQFNGRDTLTFSYLKEATGIEEGELRRCMLSLVINRTSRLLTKNPKGGTVGPDDEFTFNKDFKHKLFRIKINQFQIKETVEENAATNERVFQDRQYQVDAAIVRIMKMRRTLPHNLLVSECLSQLRFDIRPSDLKKRIENLMERDYLRRSETNSSIYEYIA